MACSTTEPDAGYVTTVGAALAFVIALGATVLVARSGIELRAARADLRRAQEEYRLDGLHRQAVAALLNAPAAQRLNWRPATPYGPAEVLAESEARKLPLSSADRGLDDVTLAKLGVSAPEGLRERIKAAARPGATALRVVPALDSAPSWRRCALSLISPYGAASRIEPLIAGAPIVGAQPNWRVGELWRIRIVALGWSDERIVRLTGDPAAPAATVERVLSRANEEPVSCERLTAAKGG